ncbi:MAG: flagellar biosynthetic protein FliQ [Synergistaceae bacterium]|jgi:flagellar biosynthetic protein FliQ|nr:flagellar biosynthetic protein FliQ [Synergistaceae bacterium]
MEIMTIGDAFVDAMWTIVLASMPILLIAMCIGLIVGIIQTATSIQEQTLAFIPKMLAVIISLVVFGPWMFRIVGGLAIRLFTDMYKYVG